MRLFIAVELSDALRSHLVTMQNAVRARAPNLSFTRPENLHLTLKFLGDVPDADVRGIADALATVPPLREFELTTDGGVVCFPERGRVRVVSAGVRAVPNLAELHHHVESAMNARGFPSEHRPYHPHITLARARAPLAASMREKLTGVAMPPGDAAAMRVNEFVLMESRLHPKGAQYIPAARFYINLLHAEQKPINDQ